jgi:hypothetical protein
MQPPLTIPPVLGPESLANLKNFVRTIGVPITTGQADRVLNAASATQTIAHKLGKIPAFFRITGFALGGSIFYATHGTYDGKTMNYVSVPTSGSPQWGTGLVTWIGDNSNGMKATLTVDQTNIKIAWTLVGTGIVGTLHFIWEVQ